ncbi:N,N-dimethylformamidase beta subunit family domain-containing protein [Ponticaulis profundi]|uniref:N,N-dimethylformamidase beta subunit family domain-containing protein n=1 Tax=Ponticaulis profundi TaxID=2665222 RepID=A0ABW1S892_9PROT
MIACYTNRLSARPGERVDLHATNDLAGECSVEVERIGAEIELVHQFDITVADHPTPSDADMNGCGWPAAGDFIIGKDWKSGYYRIRMTNADKKSTTHFVCVLPEKPGKNEIAIILATNTYHAYNYWGGANAYSHVTKLMKGQASFEDAMAQAIGTLSAERPFPDLIIAAPDDAPRLINDRKRGFKEQPWASDMNWMIKHHASPYDGSAGFVNKWEHRFAEWAEKNGIELDYYTDYDLDAKDDILQAYKCALFVGHSEYWSGKERDQVEKYVDAGGNIAILSGNTCFWKVRWENDGKTMVNHKWRGHTAEPEASKDDATHLWSHESVGRPEAELTGLSFVFAGYHRLGMCVSRGAAGYTIYRDNHWTLEGTDLFYGDVLGGEVPLIGYESDGCRFHFDEDELPVPIPMVGVPENLEIIGIAPCAFGEDPDSGYAPIIPPEQLDVIANVIYGDDSPAAQKKVLRGHAILASFKRGKGEVFNTGTTEWAHGLAAGDPFIDRITKNVLNRFTGKTGRAV